MTLEEIEFLRCIADDDTILKTYKQLKVEGKTNEEIIDYLEYCDSIPAKIFAGCEPKFSSIAFTVFAPIFLTLPLHPECVSPMTFLTGSRK